MVVSSFSSVKNDLLIYWGMIGCWPLGQTRADTINMAAFHPSAIAALCELSSSQEAQGEYFRGLQMVVGFTETPLSYQSFTFWALSWRPRVSGALKCSVLNSLTMRVS